MSLQEEPEFLTYIGSAWNAAEIHDGPEVFLSTFASVSPAAADLVAAHWLVSEVRNGAFPQFFSNSTGVLAPEAVRALRRLGLDEAAEIVEAAMSFFGEAYPRDRGVRQDEIDWVWNDELTEDQRYNLEIMLDLSGKFLDALGKDSELYVAAANRYALAHCGAA